MKRVLGYTDPWSVAPGETATLHVSLLEGEEYDLDVVRVVSGDAQGLGLDLRPVPHPLAGRHRGERHRTAIGSAMIVDPAPNVGDRFELAIALFPTLLADGRQGLIGHWDDTAGEGWLLALDTDGRLAWRVGGVVVATPFLLPEPYWCHVAATATPGGLSLSVRIDRPAMLGGPVAWSGSVEAPITVVHPARPLVAAAIADPDGGRFHRHHFNGKLARAALTRDGTTVAAWPFRPGSSADVPDEAGGPAGRLVNLPARAVTGPDWTGDIHDWRADPERWDAIHFHADDLYDAGWPAAHRLRVPDDWPSGYYAVRLRAGDDTSYLPLLVRPPRETAGASLAVLASTATTMAYANYRFHLDVPEAEASVGRVTVLTPEDVYLCETADVGLSTYDLHRDGSPVRFSSRKRPVLNNQPGGEVWNLNADTHLLAWLDRIGQPYDLITDEDLHAEGSGLLDRYRAVITGSHPEYWTTPMWDALERWLAGSGRLMYLGGNGFYWRTGLSPDWPGAVEVRRAEGGGRYTAELPGHYHLAFTGELGGLWRRSGRPPNTLVGVGSRGIGFDGVGWFRRTPVSDDPRVSWLFGGVAGETFGAEGLAGCAAGGEIDAADPALGTPPHALVVAASEGHTDAMQPFPEEILMPHPAMSARHDPRVRAEITFFETPGGGAVLSFSSLSWPGAIAWNGFTNDCATITGNALARFLDPEPFALPDH